MALDIVGLSWCTRLFSVVCRSVTLPLFPILKKGDQRVHSNYLGFPLLVLPWKVCPRVLEMKLQPNKLFTLAGLQRGVKLPIQSTCILWTGRRSVTSDKWKTRE